MSRATRITLWIAAAILGAYVPLWWALAFGGYYDDKMSSDLLRNARTFLASDLAMLLLLVGVVLGLRKRKLWGYVCGFMICGAGVYICTHGTVAILVGALPSDVATQLIFWPYLVASLVGALLLYRRLKEVMEPDRRASRS